MQTFEAVPEHPEYAQDVFSEYFTSDLLAPEPQCEKFKDKKGDKPDTCKNKSDGTPAPPL